MSIKGRVVLLKLHTEDVPDIFCLLINGVVTPIMKLLRDDVFSKTPNMNDREAYFAFYKKVASMRTLAIESNKINHQFKISSLEYSMNGYGGDDHSAQESYSGIRYEDAIHYNKKIEDYLMTQINNEVEICLI